MARLDAFFKLMFDSGASDLHITSGQPPILRVHGELERIKYDPMDPLDGTTCPATHRVGWQALSTNGDGTTCP